MNIIVGVVIIAITAVAVIWLAGKICIVKFKFLREKCCI